MHITAAHAELHIPTLRRFLQSNPLGIFTTAIKSSEYSTIQASHIPWVSDIVDPTSDTELPILRGHIARENPQSKAIVSEVRANPSSHPSETSTSHKLEDEVMILFNGLAHHYVPPKFYVATKTTTGKVVPTWNYSAVQVYGRATVYTDSKAAESIAFLTSQISDLSRNAETDIMKHDSPWQVADAPAKYIELLMKNIIGIEIEVTRMEGRVKMSQEKSGKDLEGVVKGFRAMCTEQAGLVAELVEERGEMKDARKMK